MVLTYFCADGAGKHVTFTAPADENVIEVAQRLERDGFTVLAVMEAIPLM